VGVGAQLAVDRLDLRLVAWVLAPARHLNGCLDMDLEASAMTTTRYPCGGWAGR